jgi:hypothetical protein
MQQGKQTSCLSLLPLLFLFLPNNKLLVDSS